MKKSILVVHTALILWLCPGVWATTTPKPEIGQHFPQAYVDFRLARPDLFEIKKGWRGKVEQARLKRQELLQREPGVSKPINLLSDAEIAAITVSGTIRIPVVPVQFSNTPDTHVLPSVTRLDQILFSGPNTPYGTVTDYFDEVSYGLLNLTGTVFSSVTLPQPDTFYEDENNGLPSAIGTANRTGRLMKDALDSRDLTVDFGQFDNDGPDGIANSGDDDGFVDLISFLSPESGGECGGLNIWAHSWVYSGWFNSGAYSTNDSAANGGSIQIDDYTIVGALTCPPVAEMDIGTFAHEAGHVFGIPDLYDISQIVPSQDIGYWSLMASGNWNSQDSPAHMSAWEKAELGWLIPTLLTAPLNNVSIPQVETNPAAYQIAVDNGEYYLTENRQAVGFDRFVADCGLALWHVGQNRNGSAPGPISVEMSNVSTCGATMTVDFDARSEDRTGSGGLSLGGASAAFFEAADTTIDVLKHQQFLAGGTAACSPGADGIASSLNGVVNSYYPAMTDAVAGSTSIGLGPLNGAGAATTLEPGDQVLVIQVQDAQINSSNTDSYGNGTAGEPASGVTGLGSTGLFEFACVNEAVGPDGGTLHLMSPLVNTYRASGSSTYQVIRVPQYASVTLGGGALNAAPWDGDSGGVVVLDVAGTLDWNSQMVDVSGLGFRGGLSDMDDLVFSVLDWVTSNDTAGAAPKGEGIAGTPLGLGGGGYANGDFARGAPGNGGGGGNGANGGGGGGANCGAGGQGGNSFQSSLRNGGFGGAPLPSSPSRLAFGAGGGSGEENNSSGSVGAAGGGIVMIYAGTDIGTGTVAADGLNAASATNDGGGGGGGGGSIMIAAAGAGLTVNANGGAGANLSSTQHGPGGGGGGGVVITSVPLPVGSVSVGGGVAGLAGGFAWGASPGLPGDVGTFALPPACPVGTPAFTKSFAPNPVPLNGVTTLTFTIDNTQTPIPFTNLTFTDPFPSGLMVATPANASTTCIGGAVTTNLSPPSVSYSGGSVLANSSCTVSVDVTGSTPGELVNTTDILTSDQGRLGTAVANLTVKAACSPGADGIASSLNGVVNSYYPAMTDAVAGSTSIGLDPLNGAGAATTLEPGDQVLVIQVQDAQINSSNTDSYGNGTAGEPASGVTGLGSTGLFEFACVNEAVGPDGGTLHLMSPLVNTYRASGSSTYQVIRVPQYASVTLGGGALNAAPWDGDSGGVVVLDVAGTLDWNSQMVDVSGLGFRGGLSDMDDLVFSVLDWVTSNDTAGAAPKGEGIAGTPLGLGGGGYANGDFARGAPGNGGGGGNGANGGGGGGANCGAGGQGGNSFQSSLRNGGFGGAPLPSSPSRLAFGAGGGSGEENNSSGSVGAAGGGIVMLYAGTATGTGTVAADGLDAAAATNDGGGGGGGGGSVLIATAVAGLTVTANGGAGANLSSTQHGPGGGGGGGVVITSLPLPIGSVSVAGGVEGLAGGTAWGASPGLPGGMGTFASPPACQVGPPAFTKSFAPNPVPLNGVTRLTFTIDNTQPTIPFTNLTFTDPFPPGLVVASSPNVSTTCAGGMIVANPGASQVSYSGGAVPANSSCTVRVDVTSSTAGELVNTTDILTSDQGRLGTAVANLTVPLFRDGFESGDTSAWSNR